MEGLTTVHPEMYGHLNVLVQMQRPEVAVIVTDPTLCFLAGKRSKEAYEPIEEFKRAFGPEWTVEIQTRIVWCAELPCPIDESAKITIHIKAKSHLTMRNPELEVPRIFGLVSFGTAMT